MANKEKDSVWGNVINKFFGKTNETAETAETQKTTEKSGYSLLYNFWTNDDYSAKDIAADIDIDKVYEDQLVEPVEETIGANDIDIVDEDIDPIDMCKCSEPVETTQTVTETKVKSVKVSKPKKTKKVSKPRKNK